MLSTLLCDIGNTTALFYQAGKKWVEKSAEFDPHKYDQDKIYYISVYEPLKERVKALPNWIDLRERINLPGAYETLGVDRQVVSVLKHDGVVVDAGSAITVDVMEQGTFKGGYIYPGLKAMQQSYANISSALDYSFNFELDLGTMPLNSVDAITYGALVPLIEHIKRLAKPEEIICTGGDGAIIAKMLGARYNQDYIFDAMLALLEE